MKTPLKCILWDFGNTLVDERWMRSGPETLSGWNEAYGAIIDDIRDAWDLGDMSFRDLANKLSDRMGIESDEVIAHVRMRCESINFYGNVLNVAKRCPLPQAIVTVNPDVFSEWVVPYYKLDQIFSPIVTSSEEKTLDKSDICDIALAELSGHITRKEALLIDNKKESIEGWKTLSGSVYHFRGPDVFEKDIVDKNGVLAEVFMAQNF